MLLESYSQLKLRLSTELHTWLITGVAGFIGSNLLETLLKLNQKVVGLDNFATGYQHNLDEVKSLVTPEQWANFNFIQGDICNLEDCRRAMFFHPSPNLDFLRPLARQAVTSQLAGVDDHLVDSSGELGEKEDIPVEYVLHQAALGSVPRSIEDPISTNETNISGFLNMMVAARDAKVRRFVYAASSSTYGDHPDLPKVEDKIGKPLSPYAVTKLVNELYADVFARTYSFKTIGLRYFNVFGKRQDPNGAYAAVIPRWINSLIKGESVYINGDGETSRDFCYIENVEQINLLAATTENIVATNQVYNVAVGDRTNLNSLCELLRSHLVEQFPHLNNFKPTFRDFRTGDVMHSLADISKAKKLLGYEPTRRIGEGLGEALEWYVKNI